MEGLQVDSNNHYDGSSRQTRGRGDEGYAYCNRL